MVAQVLFGWMVCPNLKGEGTTESYTQVILLMEEILHHLGFIKPCKLWDKLPTSTGDRRISAINSMIEDD